MRQVARPKSLVWIIGAALVGMTVVWAITRKRTHRIQRSRHRVADVIYELSDTRESRAFWDRNADFEPHFDRLVNLTNRCFGRTYRPANRAEDVVFDLGQA